MRLILLLAIFSLSACGIARPKADACIVNAPNENRKCYSLETDYDDNGVLKPGAKPVYRPNKTVADLNKFFVIDSPTGPVSGLKELSAWLQKLRQHYENCQNGQ